MEVDLTVEVAGLLLGVQELLGVALAEVHVVAAAAPLEGLAHRGGTCDIVAVQHTHVTAARLELAHAARCRHLVGDPGGGYGVGEGCLLVT